LIVGRLVIAVVHLWIGQFYFAGNGFNSISDEAR
jgi:hypothetical protein